MEDDKDNLDSTTGDTLINTNAAAAVADDTILKTDDDNLPETKSDSNTLLDIINDNEPSPTTPSTSAAAAAEEPREESSKNTTETAIEEIGELETTIEETTPADSPPPDFETVCEEIDQFIISLNKSASERSSPPENLNTVTQFSDLIDDKIPSQDSSSEGKWNPLLETDHLSLIDNVDRVHSLLMALREFSSDSNFADSINRIDGILQRAMMYLEDEFRTILEETKPPPLPTPKEEQDPPPDQHSGDQQDQTPAECEPVPEEDNFKGYLEESVSNLHRICRAMIKAGYEAECSQIYIITRRNVLEESLHELGFEKSSIDDIQKMQWESLERGIGSWTNTFKHFIKVQLPGERKQAETIFCDDTAAADDKQNNSSKFAVEIFSTISRAVMLSLLSFAESVAMSKRSSEKLFKFLDVYETLRDTTPAFDDIFPEQHANELKTDIIITKARLGESMVCIFCSLENSIKADTGKTPVPGGAIHPLTRYTMNYLKYACVYTETLEQIFKEHLKIERKDSTSSLEYDSNQKQQQNQNQQSKLSPFATQLTKLMDLLDSNLDTKAKLYRDTALSLIFLMNNGRYILQKIKGCVEIHELMGDTWSRKRSSEVRQYHKSYQRETWGKLLNCLSHEGLNVNGKVVKPVLKERFKSFTAMFDEIHRSQSTWVVSDEQLQSELRISITAVVIPAYRSFLARFGSTLTPGRQTEKYVKLQPEDLETQIEELFDGNANVGGGKKR
ncbi:exocyst complex component EXO70B1-like [Impatiens glandulifera]|uniref:exocyst complex component EXO70B1-like n=1 Tax=Impatiens glandulifera TaxID=253017 RepID=UPI001FB0DBB2|nr:exocyst complex component EXO70B1-like [Impatiens glandulifera]